MQIEAPLSQKRRRALALHHAGRLNEAEQHYLEILRAAPADFDGQQLFGLLRHQQGRHREALELLGAALRVRPQSASALSNYGQVLAALRQLEDAVFYFDRSLAVFPRSAETHVRRGNVLWKLRRGEEATASYEAALRINPDHTDALNNLGVVLRGLKRPGEALVSLDLALSLRPGFTEAMNNRGNALRDLRRSEEAILSYDCALRLQPRYVEALCNRGGALMDLRRFAEAIICFEQALAIEPDHAGALFYLGVALREQRRFPESLQGLDAAIAADPGHAEAFYQRGLTLQRLDQLSLARASFEKSLVLDPDHAEAEGALMGAVLHLCDWDGADARATASRANKVIVPPLTMLACSDDPALHLECARRYLRHSLPVLPEPLPRAAARKGERIRIAYLSADFREHATAFLIAELLECHDRSRFEVVGISTGQNDTSEVRARIMAACDQFHDIEAADDRRAAKLVRQLEADILVDLNGHTHGFRPGILAQRPAPVQVSYLGYPGTLGAEFMDYIIADPVVLPRSQQPFYAERIVHLPGCYQVNDTKRRASQAMPSRAECGLPEEGFVFCCFNNSGKITAPIFAVWMRLLDRTPGSVLWLFGSNNEVRANLCRQATVYGIDTARLIFAGQKPSADHLARYHLVDLFLDTLPYNAHTTASDALRMGVPLVTCMGRSFASRVAASLLAAAGLPDLVARNLNDYETMAFEIAHQPSLLGSLRRRLEDPAANTLFDLDRFRRGIESAYTRMHAIAYEGIAPYGFVVAAED